jgi:hypothetical protein
LDGADRALERESSREEKVEMAIDITKETKDRDATVPLSRGLLSLFYFPACPFVAAKPTTSIPGAPGLTEH